MLQFDDFRQSKLRLSLTFGRLGQLFHLHFAATANEQPANPSTLRPIRLCNCTAGGVREKDDRGPKWSGRFDRPSDEFRSVPDAPCVRSASDQETSMRFSIYVTGLTPWFDASRFDPYGRWCGREYECPANRSPEEVPRCCLSLWSRRLRPLGRWVGL